MIAFLVDILGNEIDGRSNLRLYRNKAAKIASTINAVTNKIVKKTDRIVELPLEDVELVEVRNAAS